MLVDSNILVYAINSASPKSTQAQTFLRQHQSSLVIAHQNILETLRVLTHPKFTHPMPITKALAAVTAISDACRVIAPDQSTGYIALELIKRHSLKADQVFDAYLLATALSAGIDTIATDNVKNFDNYKAMRVFNPFKP